MNECPNCGSSYKSLGHHYARSSCDYPNISDTLYQKLTGILMGDGCISERNNYPYMRVEMANKKFLDHLEQSNPEIFGSVRLHQTAAERASRDSNSGWNDNASEENYSDVYVIQTYSHPMLEEFASWYDSGQKEFPSVELSPIVLKYWYCCDGNKTEYDNLRIGCSNEINNVDKIETMFDHLPVEVKYDGNQIWFRKDDSRVLYEYMGGPVEGFKYKWPKC